MDTLSEMRGKNGGEEMKKPEQYKDYPICSYCCMTLSYLGKKNHHNQNDVYLGCAKCGRQTWMPEKTYFKRTNNKKVFVKREYKITEEDR